MNLQVKIPTSRRTLLFALGVLAVIFFPAQAAMAQEAGEAAGAAASQSIPFVWVWLIAPIGAIAALIFAFRFFKQVKTADPGDEAMQEIAGHVTEGAYAYLRRQYKVVAVFFVLVAVLLLLMGWVWQVQHKIVFLTFLSGGFWSAMCGFLGMKTATMASNRTTQGAKEGLNRGLTVAFRAGAVMGLVVVGFGLLDITFWFVLLSMVAPAINPEWQMSLVELTAVLLTYAMGASSQALFARVGGGIYTKAADVGADLVGKVEAGIPEDDPRNPATVADNVGDNVGDVAGMGADLYESYCGSILATAALGVAAAASLKLGVQEQVRLLVAPMVLAGVGIILSVLGIYLVRCKEGASMKQLMGALGRGVNGSSLLIVLAAAGICYLLLGDIEVIHWWGVWLSIVSGLCAGVIIGKGTEYATSYDYRPTKQVAESSETGPATVIIAGIAEGMKSTWMSLATLIVAVMAAYAFSGGFENISMGLYGVGIAAVGMLATLGITLATDAYGPIADNAGGNAEMTGQDPQVRERTDALDSVGNTTAAVGKGFAIGSAALTALALLAAYVEQVRVGQNREAATAIVARYEQGETDPEAGYGKLVNLGHGKFATKLKTETETGNEKTEEYRYEALMALSDLPEELPAVGEEVGYTAAVPGEGPFGKAGAESHVYRLMVDGEEMELVSAHEASLPQYMAFYDVTLINPKVLCGMFAGVMLVFLFSAMTMKAVGRAANAMVKEVRRQFKEIPGIMEGTGKPDYARCVAISTAGAQRAMVLPSLLALIVPVVVGLLLDVAGVLGLLAGGLTCGFAMAVFMANAGGAWDNAKKYIETGQLGGKGSENHKATVVGDTVGDPFKDTSGPSLNILIKLMSIVSVVFAGLVVKYGPQIAAMIGLE